MPAVDPAIGSRLNMWPEHGSDHPVLTDPSPATPGQLSRHTVRAWHARRARRIAMVGLLLIGTGGCAANIPAGVEPVPTKSIISSPTALPTASERPSYEPYEPPPPVLPTAEDWSEVTDREWWEIMEDFNASGDLPTPTTAELVGILSDPQAHVGENILVYAEVRRVDKHDESTTFLARDVTNSDILSDGCEDTVCGDAVFTGDTRELSVIYGSGHFVQAFVTVDGWISYRGRTCPTSSSSTSTHTDPPRSRK